jgi:hypothetical protein
MQKNTNEFVWATKKIGNQTITKRFTLIAWRLVGNKGTRDNPARNGWIQVPSEIAHKTKDIILPEATNTAKVVGAKLPPVKKETKEELMAQLEELKGKLQLEVDKENGDKPAFEENGDLNTTPENTKGNDVDTRGGDQVYNGPLSTDNEQGVVKAIAHIRTLKTVSDIEGYTKGDTRATVVKASEKFIKEIK